MLLVLAASPLTAPFQTYDIGNVPPATVTSTAEAIDPASLVSPLRTQPGQLKVVLDLRPDLIAWYFLSATRLDRIQLGFPTPLCTLGLDPLLAFTVLRL